MKKIIVAGLTFAFLLMGAQNVFASNLFNGQSGDCNPAVAIGIYPNNIPRDSYGCWTATSITANAGDTINVAMYYHNTTSSTLTNVRASITKSGSGPSTHYTFTGQMYSDQGSQTLGTATLNLTSSQTLTYSSTHWMKDANAVTSDTDTSVYYNEGQINIGSVPTGWDNYGEVLVVFKVGNTTPTPNLCQDPSATNYGGTAPCTYPQLCQDPSATNYHGSLPCTYPSLCQDPSATNYHGTAPCTYPQLCQDVNATNYHGSLPCVYPQPTHNYCTISNFKVSNNSINYGDSVTVTWDTDYCNSVSISGIGSGLANSGSRSVRLYSDKNFVINASGTYGSDSDSAYVSVNNNNNCNYYNNCNNNYNQCKITDFTADDTSINQGDSVRLRWDTDNCSSVSISGVASGLSNSGSYYVRPSYDTTYTLYAYGNNGSDSDSVKIYVNNNNNNCNYYNNYCGNNNYNTPTVSTYSPTSVTDTGATLSGYANGNGSRINTWIEFPCYGTQYGNRSNVSSGTVSYSIGNLSQNTTYNYCAVAQSRDSGQVYRGNIMSFTTTGGGYIQPPVYLNKDVVTTVATNITKSDAVLNGYITNSNYYSGTTYFNYGTTVNLGYRTNSQTTTGNSSFYSPVSGLQPNTIYYFQAVAEGPDGVTRGDIKIFKTLGDTTIKTVIVQGTTVIGSSSPVELTITDKYQAIGVGDLVDYTVTYKNIGKTKLVKPMVQVVLPTNITLVNASAGTYSVDTHTLSVPLNDLVAGEEGVIYLEGTVDSMPLNYSQIVTTAIFIYTNTSGSQENAMAYVLNVPKGLAQVASDSNSNLGASAFFAGFYTIGLVGWLFIILVILLIILVAHSISEKRSNGGTSTHLPTH